MMIVFVEDVLIENFLVTYLILLLSSKLLREKIKKTNLFFSSGTGAVVALLSPLVKLNGIMQIAFKLLGGMLVVCIAQKRNNLKLKYIAFIFLTALFGGLNILIYYLSYGTYDISDNFPSHILILILFFIYHMLSSIIKIINKQSVILNFVYSIEIENDDTLVKDDGFLDSGNVLFDSIDNTPVFIINIKLFNKLYKNISLKDLLVKDFKNLKQPHYIKSKFAIGSSKLLVFSVDQLKIKNNDKTIQINNAKLGISYTKFDKSFNCNMLINANVFSCV